MKIFRVNDYVEMSEMACNILITKMNQLKNPVLGLATGSTPEGLYKKLIHAYNLGNLSFKQTTTFNLDEYIGLPKTDPNSYHFYMHEHFFQHIDIESKNVHVPNGNTSNIKKECTDYETLIRENGHIDVQILGLGTNGHIGFNEPGTSFSSRTHIVKLAESTRRANARFFSSIDEVPQEAITMGIDTIMKSKEIIVLVSGERKADAMHSFINEEIQESFPASILQRHPHVTVVADEMALTKIKV